MSSLLPPNASELDRNIEQVAINSTDLPVQITDLWDPFSCPLSLLPWLAWAVSVDEWDDRWPENIKRQVVQNSFDVHRYKGTPYAVQKALDSLNIKSFLREWWEPDGSQEPGTMTAVALVNENLTDDTDGLLNKDTLEQVTRVIKSAKRGVIHFDVELGVYFNESVAISGGAGGPVDLRDSSHDFIPVVPDELNGDIGLSGGVGPSIGFTEHTSEFSPVTPDLVFNSFQLTAAARQLCLFDICFEGII